MAGYTAVSVCKIDESFVMLPIRILVDMPCATVGLKSRWFERMLATTQQPDLTITAEEGGLEVRSWQTREEHNAETPKQIELGRKNDEDSEVNVPGTMLTVLDGYGTAKVSRQLLRNDLLMESDHIRYLKCFHLSERFGRPQILNPWESIVPSEYQDLDSWACQAMYSGSRLDSGAGMPYYQMVRAGPRKFLHFDPFDPAASAAIVSCGGICPGLNPVIREIVNTLWAYGVRRIWGVKGGFKGVMEPEKWVLLNPTVVKDIHSNGGTMLISDRGNPPHLEMAKVLKNMCVKQYFVLGGDGTHKGAMQTFDCLQEIEHECAVVGVPKTIDNDVPIFDQTFGFDTACTEAIKAVESAYVEARCNANAIGLVKLMGRHCGFIAMNAALAARNVDICLLPEMEIDLEKVLAHTVHLMETKGFAVIIVAEGCGDTLIKGSGECDAGGNKVMADVGPWFKDRIMDRFKQLSIPLTIKYIDPTYMIRSVRSNAWDSIYCSALAQNAVHGAMAGYAGITVGKVYERYVYVPIHAITQQKGRRVNPKGRWFMRLLETTNQGDLSPTEGAMPLSPTESLAVARVHTAAREDHIMIKLSVPGSINDVLNPGDEIRRFEVVNLGTIFPSAKFRNSTQQNSDTSDIWMDDNAWTTKTFLRNSAFDDRGHVYFQMLRSGPREELHFNPSESSAVIVTCGGICPGLNSVIREIVMTLKSYKVSKVYGCIGGYKGMVTPEAWIELTEEKVQDIHMKGGTILVSDRGNPPHIDIANTLKKMNVKQYFVIGGDGTHQGAMDTFLCTQEVKHECAVVGVPKTIDNDIPILDKSFGFNTACTEAEKAIDSAYVEAKCKENCVGVVKLMGRHCGFIAMEASSAARNVDICLLPEMDISLPKLLTEVHRIVTAKGRAVVVVAEGCGDTLLKSSESTDAGGNKVLADVGPWLCDHLTIHFQKMRTPLAIRYIDPTYMIRAVPANANDSVYCSVLAQHAVHGAMAGYSGITVGKVDERFVMLPIHAITKTRSRKVDLSGRAFDRLMRTTGQGDLKPSGGDDWALMPPYPRESSPTKQRSDVLPLPELPQATDEVANDTDLVDVMIEVIDGTGNRLEERPLQRADIMLPSDQVRRFDVDHLSVKHGAKHFRSPISVKTKHAFLDDESWCVQPIASTERVDSGKGTPYYQLVRAGPRANLHFDPGDPTACAAIVTSGEVCPGLNVVIRELYFTLRRYGVKNIFGICNGFSGMADRGDWLELTSEIVQDIHNEGGTILKNQRVGRGPPTADCVDTLTKHKVRQFFVLGGGGSHSGVARIWEEMSRIGYECSVMVVPSTVDNDVSLTDGTFGFLTACSEARCAIQSAYVEATCNANAIGLVKLLGKDAGYLALTTTLASRNVDICLIPEMDICLDKVLDHCEHLMATKGYAVIVVSDGCANAFRQIPSEVFDESTDIGPWLKEQIVKRFKEKSKPLTVKYIDPTYMVRSVKAQANDSIFSAGLAEHAVHGAMAGFTGVSTVKVYERYVYMPIMAIIRAPPRTVNTGGRWFSRLRFTTQQPSFYPTGSILQRPKTCDVRDLKRLSSPVDLSKVLLPKTRFQRLRCMNLSERFPSRKLVNPLKAKFGEVSSVPEGSWTTQTIVRRDSLFTTGANYLQMMRSGPREVIHFDPLEEGAAAAIVTCGGLCPGLNSVIREIVIMLKDYGVKTVYGIKGGYKGCVKEESWIELTQSVVQDIHLQGGSILVSDRGNPPHSEIAKVMEKRKIRQYFVLGGDGTHQGAMQSFEAMTEIGHECAVVGVPKTIDNDIALLDRSFGFDTAVTEAEKAIDSAYVEATTNANCVGLVKLMGRHCGWIAAVASMAARHVDVCLVPEMNISLKKVLDHIAEVLRRQRYAVVVVAEGCGDTIISSDHGCDAGGNKVLADVGPYLKDQITNYCKSKSIPVSIKYIDPTYMIRSVPANVFDSMYCSVLAQEAVHGAMAGYSGITVGKVDERYVMLPIHSITGKGTRKLNPDGRTFELLKAATNQPSFEK
eukprot:TRINITY_DN27223_c0_g2_i1.p1 TRINITY_DN27223_c0_g2~~TRINITY_DN27223_c0_g2_i1.p1  ORF type:complete len:2094 (-),score=374.61 TRINITY_DN27223_c0_g2_i1:88-6090(-)